jgi:hypothetical protein
MLKNPALSHRAASSRIAKHSAQPMCLRGLVPEGLGITLLPEQIMISAITPSNHGKNILYLHTRDITKEDQSKFSFATRFYLSYIRGVDYKGLNGSVTSVIYHMAWNIGCIRK